MKIICAVLCYNSEKTIKHVLNKTKQVKNKIAQTRQRTTSNRAKPNTLISNRNGH